VTAAATSRTWVDSYPPPWAVGEVAGLILRILTRARRADVGRGFLRCFDLFSSSCRDAPVGATAVPTHAPLHGIRRRGVGPPGDGFLCVFLCLSFVISLVRHTSWDRPGRRAKRGACNVPSLRGLRTGKTGKNVRRHDPDRSNASMIKQKKNAGTLLVPSKFLGDGVPRTSRTRKRWEWSISLDAVPRRCVLASKGCSGDRCVSVAILSRWGLRA